MFEFREIPNPIRKHTQLQFIHHLRHAYWKTRLGALGPDTFIGNNVHFDRYPRNIRLGGHVLLKDGARLCPTQRDSSIQIGDWCSIGFHTYLFAATRIEIGDNCLIAPFCYLVDNDHLMKRPSLIREQALRTAPIVLGEDVWIGAHSVILAGVHLGRGCVIAAGSVVTQDIPAYTIAAGVPAKIIKERPSEPAQTSL